MCLILFSWRRHPDYPLVVAANRDEFHDRPTAAAGYWQEAPQILAGRDRQEGGTWLGVDRRGRIAAVTNYRNPSAERKNAHSRGELVINFLLQSQAANEYLHKLQPDCHQYNGFNLFLCDQSGIHYLASQTGEIHALAAGLYGCSNGLPDAPWPKVEQGKHGLGRLMKAGIAIDIEDIFALLSNRSPFPDESLPDTGVGLDRERMLAPVFVRSRDYGTRSSTVVIIDRDARLSFAERSFDENGEITGTVRYQFNIKS